MGIIESFRVALRALTANKLRSALTMLGMIIGVGAVIGLMSIGKGAEALITTQIKSMGSNLLFISPGSTSDAGVKAGAGTAPTLTFEDAQAIAAEIPSAAMVAPEMNFFSQVIVGSANTRTRIVGVTPEYQEVRNFPTAAGQFISQQEVDSRSRVAVLGSYTAQQLFGDSDPIEQTIRVDRQNFRVIGVLESKGAQAFGNMDDVILVPITTLQQRLMAQRTARGAQNVSTINVQVASEDLIDQAVAAIGDLLRERHRVVQDDFTIRSQNDILETFSTIANTFTLLLGAIAGISLVVGGIGIMNIMLVSVTERTREIGIRKAVGAKRRDILLQFLIEATTVAVIGGLMGIALGTGASNIISRISVQGQNIPSLVTPDAVLLAVSVSAAVGLFFGIYPATRAARLNPIEALRYE